MTFTLTVIIVVTIAVWAIVATGKKKEVQQPKQQPAPQPDSFPLFRELTEAEEEAKRQASEAFDFKTVLDILNDTYKGPLPEHDGFYWSNLYPHLYCTKIAGVNMQKGLDVLADGKPFDAQLVPEPENPHDANAIRIEDMQNHIRLGYIPADETDDVRTVLHNRFPYPCKALIERVDDYDDDTFTEHTFLVGKIAISRPSVSPCANT